MRLKELTDLYGVSGQESAVSDYIKKELSPNTSTIVYDALGSIIIQDNGNSSFKVALVTHIDEVGFMVRHILSNGTLTLFPLGRILLDDAIGAKVCIGIDHSIIQGVICIDDFQDRTYDALYVDIQCISEKEVRNKGIKEGAWVCFINEFTIDEDVIIAKALDNRLSCALAMDIFQKLSNTLSYQLSMIGSVQEEVGTRGANTAMLVSKPDVCIVIDVASPKKIGSVVSRQLGKGPVICLADKTALASPRLVQLFSEISEQYSIPIQYDYLGGGTDVGAIQQHNIETMALILPVDKCHTPKNIASQKDYEYAFSLLCEFLLKISLKNKTFI